MPYRDPANRAAWMREYRKRKRLGKTGAPVSLRPTPSIVRGPGPSPVETFLGDASRIPLALAICASLPDKFDAALNALGAATVI
jgi:hypothetical protein